MVSARPSSRLVVASQPSSVRARAGSDCRTMTSLPSGRTRAGSSTTSASTSSSRQASANSSPIDSVRPVPSWIVVPSSPSVVAARTNPSTVSVDEREVAARIEASEVDLPGPGQELAQHRRQDGALGLARAVRVERPQDDRRHAVAAVEGERQLVGGHLGRRVRRLGLERVGLGDRAAWPACRTPRWSRSG